MMRRFLMLISVSLLMSAACVSVKFPTVTPRPTRTPTEVSTTTPVDTATPQTTHPPDATETVTAALEDLPGDPAEGDRLFHTFQPAAGMACMTCHRTDSDERLVGPGLKDVAIRAQTRVAGLTVSQYLHTSIINPSAYVVDDYPDLMPKNWGKVFTSVQVDDLVAYLISLSQ